ncbi:MAG: rhomboid family intramembrane serine protease [Bacteroidales bacterium]|nr:rhomboid family intramembrane serine protease [Bacteroidales bacterium]
MAGIIDEIKESFKKGNMLTKLIYINVGVFLLIWLVFVAIMLGSSNEQEANYRFWTYVINNLAIPSNPELLLQKPWTVITSIFTHYDFFHFLFNLLWLYWFSKMLIVYIGGRQLLGLYLLGGIFGSLLYVASFNSFPIFEKYAMGSALGASGAIYAIVVATAVLIPNQQLFLLFLGPVKIKYIALVSVILGTLVDFNSNTGGKIAHLGGAIVGYVYMIQYKKGKDITFGLGNFVGNFNKLIKRRKRKKMKVTYKAPTNDFDYNLMKAEKQKKMDVILDKISQSGYDTLSKEEKEFLFNMSNRN